MLVEEQIARSLAVLNCQGGEGAVFRVKPHHAPEIDGADDIDVVQDERLLQARIGIEKEMGGLLQAAAGVEQLSSRETSILMPKLSLAFRYSTIISAQ